MKRKGYNDPVLLKLAIAFHTFLSEVMTSYDSRRPAVKIFVYVQLSSLDIFIDRVWRSLRALEPDKSGELLEDGSQMAVWTEIFKIYCILQR